MNTTPQHDALERVMSEASNLLNDVREAKRQDIFTHEANNWLASIERRLETIVAFMAEPTPSGPVSVESAMRVAQFIHDKYGSFCDPPDREE